MFTLKVSDGSEIWHVYRRFSDFRTLLHLPLLRITTDICPPTFPSRTIVGQQFDNHVIEQRKQFLEHYLQFFFTDKNALASDDVQKLVMQFLDPSYLPAAISLTKTSFRGEMTAKVKCRAENGKIILPATRVCAILKRPYLHLFKSFNVCFFGGRNFLVLFEFFVFRRRLFCNAFFI